MSWLSMIMDSETASSVNEHAAAAAASRGGTTDTTGRHRILAELKRVEQESKFLEEELEELDKSENVSTTCEENRYSGVDFCTWFALFYQPINWGIPLFVSRHWLIKSLAYNVRFIAEMELPYRTNISFVAVPQVAALHRNRTRSSTPSNNWPNKPYMGSMVRRASGCTRLQMLDTLICCCLTLIATYSSRLHCMLGSNGLTSYAIIPTVHYQIL
ncbi:hypothetical protein Patl1_03276 [Pistacia atlantica]|uniref:Uncharacterized protein n=1 Tax=Pistacia atlantica TaxID=434234 RepID=A0ACC1C7E9_9ROSI|nr:hypothetical protein Patl1_03276 [Pistacia atlantica]